MISAGRPEHSGPGLAADGAIPAQLTAPLQSNDRYVVQGLDPDAAEVAKARAYNGSGGAYGPVSVDQSTGSRLPYVNNLVNLLVISEDCEAGIMKIADKYVHWSTDWTGRYEGIYHFTDDWRGPWQAEMRILPYGGNGKFLQDREGDWWQGYFPNSNDYATRAQNICRMNM